MAEQLRIQDTRPAADPAAIEWFSDADDAPRHAFPAVDGFRHSICALRLRWTVKWSRPGNADCLGCMTALKERILIGGPRRSDDDWAPGELVETWGK